MVTTVWCCITVILWNSLRAFLYNTSQSYIKHQQRINIQCFNRQQLSTAVALYSALPQTGMTNTDSIYSILLHHCYLKQNITLCYSSLTNYSLYWHKILLQQSRKVPPKNPWKPVYKTAK